MHISYLANHPEFIDALVSWSLEQWRFVLPEDTTAIRTAKFQAHLNRQVLPIAWIAHSEDEVFGMAALRTYDLEGREDLTPWLGGVLVGPPFRRRGIGTALCRFVEEKACAVGVRTLYLFTLDRQAWYVTSGWRIIEQCSWHGHPGNIMQKQLNATQHCAAAGLRPPRAAHVKRWASQEV